MSRELFRLVGVWSGCLVVRDASRVIINMHGKTTIKKIYIYLDIYIHIYVNSKTKHGTPYYVFMKTVLYVIYNNSTNKSTQVY
jgi:hypothetical protein